MFQILNLHEGLPQARHVKQALHRRQSMPVWYYYMFALFCFIFSYFIGALTLGA
jgi:hypothetical protein